MPSNLTVGDFLYHSIHGLCRVERLKTNKSAGKEVISYDLVPKVTNRNNARFTFEKHNMEETGFRPPISSKEAKSILNYFKKGRISDAPVQERSFAEETQTWELAKLLLQCAHGEFDAKDQKRRRHLERAARGLLLELAFVLKIPVAGAVTQVKESLQTAKKVHPLVVAALTSAGED